MITQVGWRSAWLGVGGAGGQAEQRSPGKSSSLMEMFIILFELMVSAVHTVTY